MKSVIRAFAITGFAQAAWLAPAPALAESMILEEIVVLATRRAEDLSEVPVAVTAMTGDQLEDLRVKTVVDLAPQVPNLSFSTTPGSSLSPVMGIRGVLTRSKDATLDTAVGVYQDEVFLARGYSVLGDMLDIERVEVLRGPQGTLFGRNTIGGAIQVFTVRPEIGGGYDGHATLTTGNLNLYEGKFGATLPLGDQAAMRVAGKIAKRDGFTKSYLVDDTFNPLAGQFGYIDGTSPVIEEIDSNNIDSNAFRVSFAWEPSDVGRLDLSYYRSDSETDGLLGSDITGDLATDIAGLTPFGLSTATGASQYYGYYSAVTDVAPYTSAEVDIITGKYVHSFEAFDVKLIVSHAEAEIKEDYNADGYVQSGQPIAFQVGTFNEGEVEQDTVELQFSGGLDRLDWIAGLYYFEEKALDQNVFAVQSSKAEAFAALLPPSHPLFPQALLFTTVSLTDVTAKNTSKSVYGSVNYSFTDQFLVRVGGRYTEDSKGYDGRTTSTTPLLPFDTCAYTGQPVTPNSPCTSEGSVPKKEKFDNFTWDLSLDYHFTDDVFGYAKVGTGYRTGGISLAAADPDSAQPFDSDEVTSYEMGLKAHIAGSAYISATAFYVDYTDVQLNVPTTNPRSCAATQVPLPITCNFGDAESQGFELEANWQITDALGVRGTFGFTDIKYDEVSSLLTPDWEYSITAVWDAQVGDMPLFGTLTWSQTDDWIATEDLDVIGPAAVFDGRKLLSARLTLSVTQSLDVSLWSNNLLDEKYYASGNAAATPVFFYVSGIPGESRTYGADLTLRF